MSTKLPIALQMYTLRDDATSDFAVTLEKVAQIGYQGVELAGLHGLDAAAVRNLLDSNNLFAVGTHTGLDAIESSIQQVIDDNLILGSRYVSVPYLADNRRTSIDDYKKLAEILNGFGMKFQSAGLGLAYHNHAFEFEKLGGSEYALDVLFGATDPQFVKVELDTFWVKKAGVDPAAYMGKYAGRVPLIHLKDMTPEPEATFAPVGEGTMDFQSIFDAAGAAGGEYYIVEQDMSKTIPPMEAVTLSYNNLKKMGMVS